MRKRINYRFPWLPVLSSVRCPCEKLPPVAQCWETGPVEPFSDSSIMRLLISFVFLSTLVLHAQAATAGVGETCSDSLKCSDPNAVCKADKKCACKANYDNNGGACKLIAGQSCTDKNECSSGVCKNNQCGVGETCSDSLKCSDPNAVCKADNKCACKAYYQSNGGACKLIAGQPCTDQTKNECSSGVCKNNKCGVGEPCSASADCSDPNAECKPDKKCACKAYYESNGGACKLIAGKPCTDKNDCSSGVCKNKECAPAAGASAVAASLILMVLTLMTSRFL